MSRAVNPKPQSVDPNPRVLVVDSDQDSAEVLHAMLRRKGVGTVSTRQARDGVQLAKSCEPEVIVLDVDSLSCQDVDTTDFVDLHAPPARLVLLGNLRMEQTEVNSAAFFSKPYHYATLLRKIEGLLSEARAA